MFKTGQLGPSDTVAINCVLNTRSKTLWTKTIPVPDKNNDVDDEERWIHTAMDKGDEMCGALLMYYPHNPAARFTLGSIIGGGDSSHFVTTMCSHYDDQAGKCDKAR